MAPSAVKLYRLCETLQAIPPAPAKEDWGLFSGMPLFPACHAAWNCPPDFFCAVLKAAGITTLKFEFLEAARRKRAVQPNPAFLAAALHFWLL